MRVEDDSVARARCLSGIGCRPREVLDGKFGRGALAGSVLQEQPATRLAARKVRPNEGVASGRAAEVRSGARGNVGSGCRSGIGSHPSWGSTGGLPRGRAGESRSSRAAPCRAWECNERDCSPGVEWLLPQDWRAAAAAVQEV